MRAKAKTGFLHKSLAFLLCACLLSAGIPVELFAYRVAKPAAMSAGAVSRTDVLGAQIALLERDDVLSGLRALKAIADGPQADPQTTSARRLLAFAADAQLLSAGAGGLDAAAVTALRKANQALTGGADPTLLESLSSIVEDFGREETAESLDIAFDNAAEEDDEESDPVDARDSEGSEPPPEAELAPAPKKEPNAVEEATHALFRLRYNVKGDAYDILAKKLGGDVGDSLLHRDVERILRRLLSAAALPREAAQIYIGNSMLPNAFTTVVPSEAAYLEENAGLAKTLRISNIFLSLGLLRSMESEDQLAFIIAHELMHNWKNHLKDFSGGGRQMLGHFHELEADAEGLKLAAAAGYKPQAAIDSLYALDREFDRLEKEYTLLKKKKERVGRGPAEFTRHPSAL